MEMHVVLVGFMGAGKSTVGRLLARRLHRPFIDVDRLIESMASATVADLFAERGEAVFRILESEAIERAVSGEAAVIAVGGGALQRAANVTALRRRGELVWLQAPLGEMVERALREGGRPLLAGDVEALYRSRVPDYSMADVTVAVGGLSPEEAAKSVAQRIAGRLQVEASDSPDVPPVAESVVVPVDLGSRAYDVHVGSGLMHRCGELCAAVGLPDTGLLVTNPTVGGLYAGAAVRALSRAGLRVPRVDVEDGEEHKTMGSLRRIFDGALQFKLGRDSTFFALGGGVIGDVTGFAAATYMRGVDFVQLPTTLLAQVDSSVGGKTGINLPQGKNLVGAFYQPKLVVADVDVLATLPGREMAAGMAEVIKYGAIGDGPLLGYLEDRRERLRALDRPALATVVARSCENKARIVLADEKETAGVRELLNFGHTVGHAFEALGGYTRWLHGEAVAMGMVTAALLSRRLGGLTDDDVERLVRLLRAYDLPVSPGTVDVDELLVAVGRDKKVRGGRLRFVLLRGLGSAFVSDEVTDECIREAVREQQTL